MPGTSGPKHGSFCSIQPANFFPSPRFFHFAAGPGTRSWAILKVTPFILQLVGYQYRATWNTLTLRKMRKNKEQELETSSHQQDNEWSRFEMSGFQYIGRKKKIHPFSYFPSGQNIYYNRLPNGVWFRRSKKKILLARSKVLKKNKDLCSVNPFSKVICARVDRKKDSNK